MGESSLSPDLQRCEIRTKASSSLVDWWFEVGEHLSGGGNKIWYMWYKFGLHPWFWHITPKTLGINSFFMVKEWFCTACKNEDLEFSFLSCSPGRERGYRLGVILHAQWCNQSCLCNEASKKKKGLGRASRLVNQNTSTCHCARPQTPVGQKLPCSGPRLTYLFIQPFIRILQCPLQ